MGGGGTIVDLMCRFLNIRRVLDRWRDSTEAVIALGLIDSGVPIPNFVRETASRH